MSTIEFAVMAENLSKFLLPYLPFLIKGGKLLGKEAFKAIGKEFGEETGEQVKQVWKKLKGKLEKKPAMVQEMQKVADKADHPKSEVVLAFQLEELLGEFEDSLLEEIQKMLDSDNVKNIVIASGERSVAIGKIANNSTITTGDSNFIISSDKKG